MKPVVAAFFAGVVFAIGLCVSGMTDPQKVLGFLDIAGHWDPSLAFVMVGAVGVHAIAARIVLRKPRPVWASRYFLPTRREIDLRLVTGAALFGLGWGIAGYCPGPAIVNLVAPSAGLLTFVVAMALGALVLPVSRVLFRAAPLRSLAEPPSSRASSRALRSTASE